jgi:UPF0755 protein
MTLVKRKKLAFCILTLFCMLLLLVGWIIYSIAYVPLISKKSPPLIISLGRSTTAYQFAQKLKDHKLILSSRLFLTMIRLAGLSHQLKAGVYQIQPGETAMNLLHRVVTGEVLIQNFKIIEGTTQHKVAQDLLQATYLEYNPNDWFTIKDNHPNAEGLLLADTYHYSGGSGSKILLNLAHKNLVLYLNDSWAHRESNLPYKNPYELLIAASIIEKETAIAQERKLISGVLVNRLKKNMPLQMDPTVIYGLGTAYKGKLSHDDMLINSPYNSYLYRGLPPTPIAMVGKEAIEAAAHPQWSNYLYFVAKGDGSHQFSERYEQQKKAINLYQRKGH